MFQNHKKGSTMLRPESTKKTSVLLSNLENHSKSILMNDYDRGNGNGFCIRNSLVSCASKKSSIGKFINLSKNSIFSQKKSLDQTNYDISSPGPIESLAGMSQLNLLRRGTIMQEERVKLSKNGNILQRMLQGSLELNKNIDKTVVGANPSKVVSVDLGKYCRKIKMSSFESLQPPFERTMKGASLEKKVMGVYSRENIAMSACKIKMSNQSKLKRQELDTKKGRIKSLHEFLR